MAQAFAGSAGAGSAPKAPSFKAWTPNSPMQFQKQMYSQNYTPPSPSSQNVDMAGTPSTYTVQSGDNLSKIGQKYGVNWQDIARWNNISNPNRINVGQRLNIHASPIPTSRANTASGHGSAIPVTSNPPTNNLAPNDFSQFAYTPITLADVAKKYGIDTSQQYALDQATQQSAAEKAKLSEALQADQNSYNLNLQQLLNAYNQQQATLNQQKQANTDLNKQNLQQIQDTLNQGLANTDQQYFLKGLTNAQTLANNGINSGLANDSNLRLAMNKQNAVGALDNTSAINQQKESSRYAQQAQALADALVKAQDTYNTGKQGAYNAYTNQTGTLQSQLANLAAQTQANAQTIHQKQIMDALNQMNTLNSQGYSNADNLIKNYLAERNQNINQSQFGQNMAWNIEQLKQQIAAANGAYAGFNPGSGGGGGVATQGTPASYQNALAQAVQIENIPANQIPAMNWVIQHESSFNPSAQNPHSTAYGLGQFLNSTIQNMNLATGLNYRRSPVDQIAETYAYMVKRYGSPTKAMQFWAKNGWY